MVAAANLVEVAALVGDTARATMLNALMGGQSLTATELAYCAHVSRSTEIGRASCRERVWINIGPPTCSAFSLRGLAIVSREQFGPCQTVLD